MDSEDYNSFDFSWDILESETLILPNELLVYYLYKYYIDRMNKKEVQEKEDIYNINVYVQKLRKRVVDDVFKIDM